MTNTEKYSSRENLSRTLAPELTEVTSFIGTEIGDPCGSLAEKAPRTAKHVVTVSWSWSPAHSRRSEYRIATDGSRKTWDLYEIFSNPDGGKCLCSRVATGGPYKKITAERAAYQLIKAAWQAEIEQWEFDPSGVMVDLSGLLNQQDIDKIVCDIEWVNCSSWLQEQSEASLYELKSHLPVSLDETSIDTLDEIKLCVQDLGRPQDFLELCKQYDLKPSNLISLIYSISRDATTLRAQKSYKSAERINSFRSKIDLLVSELRTEVGRGGGMTIPSLQKRVTGFLESYIGEYGSLPTGIHKVNDFFGPEFDFDALRQKYNL